MIHAQFKKLAMNASRCLDVAGVMDLALVNKIASREMNGNIFLVLTLMNVNLIFTTVMNMQFVQTLQDLLCAIVSKVTLVMGNNHAQKLAIQDVGNMVNVQDIQTINANVILDGLEQLAIHGVSVMDSAHAILVLGYVTSVKIILLDSIVKIALRASYSVIVNALLAKITVMDIVTVVFYHQTQLLISVSTAKMALQDQGVISVYQEHLGHQDHSVRVVINVTVMDMEIPVTLIQEWAAIVTTILLQKQP